MSTKAAIRHLDTISNYGNVYERFQKDQVLTENQLNRILDYVEDQLRITRTYLTGVGIVCGMKISYKNNRLTISKGTGITTDGDILYTDNIEFDRAFPFTDNLQYAQFNGLNNILELQQIGSGKKTDEQPLNQTSELEEHIVLAYLESYDEFSGICKSDCDNTGAPVFNNLKFLLIHKDEFSSLVTNDSIFNAHNVWEDYDNLNNLALERVVYLEGQVDSTNDLLSNFYNKINAINTDGKTVLDLLKENYKKIIGILNKRTDFKLSNIDTTAINSAFTELETLNFHDSDIQYRYDQVRDLTETYQEILELLLHIAFECKPTEESFPKHLVLGSVEDFNRESYRHRFYSSYAFQQMPKNFKTLSTLCAKFYSLLTHYDFQPNQEIENIKITPSKDYEHPLSSRAIPYYYNLDQEFIQQWNPKLSQARRNNLNLGYRVPEVYLSELTENPLKFNHLNHEFYRIEGHLGLDFLDAYEQIQNLKALNQLSFDVKMVSVHDSLFDTNDYKCLTKDLEVLLKAWEKEFQCKAKRVADFFGGFDIKNPGTNVLYDDLIPTDHLTVADAVLEAIEIPDLVESNWLLNPNFAFVSNVNFAYKSSDSLAINESLRGNTNYTTTTPKPDCTLAKKVINTHLGNIATLDTNTIENQIYYEKPIEIYTTLAGLASSFWIDLYNRNNLVEIIKDLKNLCSNSSSMNKWLKQQDKELKHKEQYTVMLNEVKNLCCYIKKLEWIETELEERKNSVFNHMNFNQLIEKSIGIEHLGGVTKSGTFFLVYGGKKGGTIQRNVIADFMIPYQCCSDCAPTQVIIQKENTEEEKTDLAIPKNNYCADEFPNGETLTPTPENGEIKCTTQENMVANNLFFPGNITDNNLGKELSFTVNGQTVDTNATVYKMPTINPTSTVVEVNSTEWIVKVDFNPSFTKNYLVYEIDGQIGKKISNSPRLEIKVPPFQDDVVLNCFVKNKANICSEVRTEIEVDPLSVENNFCKQPLKSKLNWLEWSDLWLNTSDGKEILGLLEDSNAKILKEFFTSIEQGSIDFNEEQEVLERAYDCLRIFFQLIDKKDSLLDEYNDFAIKNLTVFFELSKCNYGVEFDSFHLIMRLLDKEVFINFINKNMKEYFKEYTSELDTINEWIESKLEIE